jgi:site-specific recombinase XerD
MTPIATHISAFLRDHLVIQRGASDNTCDTYAISFQLLFEFAATQLNLAPSCLSLEQIDATLIAAFLEHLEAARGNSPSTRNVRLAAIKSFFRFVEYRVPSALEQIRRVLAIPFKKTDAKLVPHLNREETQNLLDAVDPSTRDGIRDRAMLHLSLAAGLRVSELIGLRMQDITLQPTPSILIHGKGRRERALPLSKETAAALRAWLAVRSEVAVPEVFVNAKGGQLSRWGFAHILKKYVRIANKKCVSLQKKRVSPHVLRHTCAMTVLQATHDIRKVALWLGHSSTKTTEAYTRTDPTEKLSAIESMTPWALKKGRFRPPDKLIAFLKGIDLCGANTMADLGSGGIQTGEVPITNRSP